jgi:hypothetical protein
MSVFVSYCRNDRDVVASLRDELEEMRGGVWIDNRLSGGQDWWSEILEGIRACDLFVLALSTASLQSEACMAEFQYAMDTHRPVLPVAVGSVDPGSLPDDVSRLQLVPFSEVTTETIRGLAKALLHLRSAPPLPDPLPMPPPLPRSYGDDFRRRLALPQMTSDEQVELSAVLMSHCEDPIHREDALELLGQLRARTDATYRVVKLIDSFVQGAPTTPPEVHQATELPPPVVKAADTSGTHTAGLSTTGLAQASAWERRLIQTLAPFKTSNFLVAPEIPPRKVVRARQTANVPGDARVVALIDCTIFGSAADAVVFTLGQVYHHHPHLKKNTEMRYSEWAACGAVGAPLSVTLPNGETLFQLGGSTVNGPTLVRAMNEVAAILEEMPVDLR